MAKVTIDLGKLETIATARAREGVKKATLAGAVRLQVDLLNRSGEGAIRRGGPKKGSRASLPGAPPAPDSGNLRAKTQADQVIAQEGTALVGRIVSNTTYAHALEVGTERIAARPFLSRLKSDHSDELVAAFVAGARED